MSDPRVLWCAECGYEEPRGEAPDRATTLMECPECGHALRLGEGG